MFESPEIEEYTKHENANQEPNLLNTIKKWLEQPRSLAIVALVVGLILGLLFGWGVWPVKWTDASVAHLRADLQQEWVRMTADSYASGASDEAQAVIRLQTLGDSAQQVINDVQLDFENTTAMTKNALAEVLTIYYLQIDAVPVYDEEIVEDNDPGNSVAENNATGQENSKTTLYFALSCLVLLIFGAVVAYFFLKKPKDDEEYSASLMAQDISINADQTGHVSNGQDKPISQWVTTYLKGDDLFDDSFSIDTGIGEFMGECGVGIGDTIGVGEPKRVSAFEVWLFDKNDIQTVTKVLMSEHLNNDDANRNRLAAKGEPILLNPGVETILETETLQMVVRVMDMAYGEGALPDNSFFERVSLELTVWAK